MKAPTKQVVAVVTKEITVKSAENILDFIETDQVAPAGRWRLRLDGDKIYFERATAADWSTYETWLTYDKANEKLILGKKLDASALKMENLGAPDSDDDVPRARAGDILSGTFAVGRGGTGLSTIALGGILYASALDTLSRLAPAAANQVLRSTAANALQFAALVAADIPNLSAAKITSGQFPLGRMPRAASGLFLEGNGATDPIYNALVAADIPSLDAAKIATGTFAVGRGGTGLSTIALGGILYASALDTLSRLAPTAGNQVLRATAANALQFAALVAADIPNLSATKITSGRLPSILRLPTLTTDKIWGGVAGVPAEIDMPTPGIWTLAETLTPSSEATFSSSTLAAHDLWMIIYAVAHDVGAAAEQQIYLQMNDETTSKYDDRYIDDTAIITETGQTQLRIGSGQRDTTPTHPFFAQILITGKGPAKIVTLAGMGNTRDVAYNQLLNGIFRKSEDVVKFTFLNTNAVTGTVKIYYMDF